MAVSTKLFATVLLGVVAIILIFQALGETSQSVAAGAGNVSLGQSACLAGGALENDTGNTACGAPAVFPLTSLFKRKGIILLAVMAGIALVIMAAVMPNRS